MRIILFVFIFCLDTAFFFFELVEQYLFAPEDQKKTVHLWYEMELNFSHYGFFTQTPDYLEQAGSIGEALKDKKKSADALESMGMVYENIQAYSSVLNCFRKALNILEEEEEATPNQAAILYRIGRNLMSQEQLKRERTIEIATAIALMVTLVGSGIIVRYYQLKRQAHKKLKQLNEKISGQKNMLEKQKEKLEELDKMKSHFFTNISHEFRTPLTVIDGMVHQMKNAPEEWLEKGLKLIERNNANLLHLVNQILDLRKLESGKLQLNLELDDVTYYLNYIIEPFHTLAENRNIKLHFLCDEKEIMMDYDKEKLLQIISNLLSNAIKFTPEGGNIYLMIKKESSTYKAQADCSPITEEQLLIQVRDTGIGIPEEKIPHIFARFYQVENWLSHEKEGTGIGLALTQELVKLMKGTISVKSESKRGTTFIISLPITRKAKIQKVTSPNDKPKD